MSGLKDDYADLDKVLNGINAQLQTVAERSGALRELVTPRPVFSVDESFTIYATYYQLSSQISETTDHFVSLKDSIGGSQDCDTIRTSAYSTWFHFGALRIVLAQHADPQVKPVFEALGNQPYTKLGSAWTSVVC